MATSGDDRTAACVLPALADGAQEVYFMSGGCWCYLRTPASYKNSESGGGAKQPCVPGNARNSARE